MKTKKYFSTFIVLLLTAVQFVFGQDAAPAKEAVVAAAEMKCSGYTLTQGAYGSGNGAGARALSNFSGSISIGCSGGSTLTLTSVSAIVGFLPSGGTGRPLDQSYTNPSNSDYSNVLAGQLITVTLNAMFSNIGGQFIGNGPYAGKTVNEFLAIANNAIGGCQDNNFLGNFSDLTSTADMINQNYDEQM